HERKHRGPPQNSRKHPRDSQLRLHGVSENKPNSESVGQTGDLRIRRRTLSVVTGWPRTKRQLPMLVPVPNCDHWPSCPCSIANDSTRWPSGKNSRRRTTLNVTGLLNSSTTSALVAESSVAQYVSRLPSRRFAAAKRASLPRVLDAVTLASRARSCANIASS